MVNLAYQSGMLRITLLAVALPLAACTTSNKGSLIGTTLGGDSKERVTTLRKPGTNPNDGTRLLNTQNALTDYCPAVRIRAGTESFRDVPKGRDKKDSDSVRYQATITKVARECSYVGQNLEIKVGAQGRVITGPLGGPGKVDMPIRVAVTRGTDTIYSTLHRPSAQIAQGSSNTNFSFVDEKVVIPAPSKTNVRVYVGFDEGPYNTP